MNLFPGGLNVGVVLNLPEGFELASSYRTSSELKEKIGHLSFRGNPKSLNFCETNYIFIARGFEKRKEEDRCRSSESVLLVIWRRFLEKSLALILSFFG